MTNHTTNYTITVTTIFDARQTQLHNLDRPLPTLGQLVDAWIIGATLIGFITWRVWAYIVKGRSHGQRVAQRLVVCLWLLDFINFVLLCERLYGIHIYSAEQLPLSRESVSRITRLLRIVIVPLICIHACIAMATWKEIYAANGNSKVHATLWTMATWCPGVSRRLATTHCVAFSRLGVAGTTRALVAPEGAYATSCPRLRMSSGLSNMISARHDSRWNLVIGSGLILVLNYLAVIWVANINATFQMKLLPGHPGLKPSIPLSSLYTILYLAIKSRPVPALIVPQANTEEVPPAVTRETIIREEPRADTRDVTRPTTPAAMAPPKLHDSALTAYLPLALALGTAALCG